jgi:hypothetical protein
MNEIKKVKESIEREKKIIREINLFFSDLINAEEGERKMVQTQIKKLKDYLREENNSLPKMLNSIRLDNESEKILPVEEKLITKKEKIKSRPRKYRGEKISEFDRNVLKRLKRKEEEKKEKKEEKPSSYIKTANKLFSSRVMNFMKKRRFVTLEKDLIKSNLGYTPVTYVSITFMTVVISMIFSLFIFIFLLFFDLTSGTGFVFTLEGIFTKIMQTIWILFIIPAGTILFMVFYPSMERKSLEAKIDQELPFATIHMAAVSGSRIEPTKIFQIVIMTKEYINLEKEFNKLLNEINVYGYDLVTALKDSAINSPSQKLSDLFNGLATTITSGGDLYDFFNKRAQTLLFDYRLDKEKQTKSAETFMDIYISVVIAAPMILMLLLIMMKISGLGIALTTSMLTFMVVGGVSLVNIAFLVFLQIKQQSGGVA